MTISSRGATYRMSPGSMATSCFCPSWSRICHHTRITTHHKQEHKNGLETRGRGHLRWREASAYDSRDEGRGKPSVKCRVARSSFSHSPHLLQATHLLAATSTQIPLTLPMACTQRSLDLSNLFPLKNVYDTPALSPRASMGCARPGRR